VDHWRASCENIFWSIDGELLEHFWCGTLENIEDIQVIEVTKDIQAEFQKEGEEKRARIEGRINSFDDAF
jgi:hypothetical protein